MISCGICSRSKVQKEEVGSGCAKSSMFRNRIHDVSGVLWTGGLSAWIEYLTRWQINIETWTDCKVLKALHHFCQQNSSSLLVIMTVEKCFALYFPLQTKRFCTVGTAKKITFIFALIFCLFNAQFFFIYDAEIAPNGEKRCIWPSQRYEEIYYQIDAFLYSFIPLTVMFTANCLIISKFMIAKYKNRRGGTESVNQALSKSAVKGTVMLLTVSFAFIILTAPICITYAITVDPPVIVYGVTVILVYLNHSINGVLYSISGSRFRQELVKLFVCCGTCGNASNKRESTEQIASISTSVS